MSIAWCRWCLVGADASAPSKRAKVSGLLRGLVVKRERGGVALLRAGASQAASQLDLELNFDDFLLPLFRSLTVSHYYIVFHASTVSYYKTMLLYLSSPTNHSCHGSHQEANATPSLRVSDDGPRRRISPCMMISRQRTPLFVLHTTIAIIIICNTSH